MGSNRPSQRAARSTSPSTRDRATTGRHGTATLADSHLGIRESRRPVQSQCGRSSQAGVTVPSMWPNKTSASPRHRRFAQDCCFVVRLRAGGRPVGTFEHLDRSRTVVSSVHFAVRSMVGGSHPGTGSAPGPPAPQEREPKDHVGRSTMNRADGCTVVRRDQPGAHTSARTRRIGGRPVAYGRRRRFPTPLGRCALPSRDGSGSLGRGAQALKRSS